MTFGPSGPRLGFKKTTKGERILADHRGACRQMDDPINNLKRREDVMKSLKFLCGVCAVVCALFVATPAMCGDGVEGGNGQGVCNLDGAWFGTSPAWGLTWPIVYQSTSHSTGTVNAQFIGGDPTLGGFFPVTSLSRTTGTWVRTGRRTFDYTMIHYGLAEGGQQPVFIGKLSGSIVVSGQCDHLEVTNVSLALYDPTQDPFGEEPPAYGCIPDGSLSIGQRIPVQPPSCEP